MILGLRVVTTRVFLAVFLGVVLGAAAACSGGQGNPESAPTPGASETPTAVPPSAPMDVLERSVAERLSAQLRDEGLGVSYVDCPEVTGGLPATLDCDGYVEGVVGQVLVDLSDEGGAVEFDARLDGGVVATSRLVRRLESEGMGRADCGETPAYPARIGLEIVCSVRQDGETSYVVATVTDRRGAVEIAEH